MVMTESEIAQCALPIVIEQGERLLENGEVAGVWGSGEDVIAIVGFPQRHRVVVTAQEDRPIHFDCSCGFSWGGACEHVVAAMLAFARGSAGEGDWTGAIEVEEIHEHPAGRLYLNESQGVLLVEIRFAYRGGIAEFERRDHSAYRLVPSVSTERVWRIVRSRAREDALVRGLAQHQLVQYKPGVYTTDGPARDWVLRELPSLAATGFEIYGQQRLRTCRVRETEPHVHLGVSSSGDESFTCQIAVDFDGVPASLAALVDAARWSSRYVLLADGSTGIMPSAWMQALAMLFGMAETNRDAGVVRFGAAHLSMLDILLELADEADIDEPFRQRLEALRDFEGIRHLPPPPGFNGHLRPYQTAGYDWLCFLNEFGFGGCLADDMGLGKTVQTLALLLRRKADARPKRPSLVVVPASILFNWEREARQFAPSLLVMSYHGAGRKRYAKGDFDIADVVLSTYGTVLRDVDMLKNIGFDYVVLDEAQVIKNPLSQAARTVRELEAHRRLALSGTPIENSLTELWSIFAFLNPGMLGSYRAFVRGFAVPIQRRGDEKAAALLRRMLSPFVLRRTKSQVEKDLPPKSENLLYVEMLDEQRAHYELTREVYRTRVAGAIERGGLEKSRLQVLEGLLRLRQVCCHPALADSAYQGDSAKFILLEEQLEQIVAEKHRVLVFSQFVKALRLARQRVGAMGISSELLTGESKNRREIVDRFQSADGVPALFASLKAGGVGLNLTAADYVVHLDPWWNPAVENQASDRAHRIGQSRPVFVYKFITRDSIEQKVMELQMRKKQLIETIVTTEESFFKQLSREEILGLFEQ